MLGSWSLHFLCGHTHTDNLRAGLLLLDRTGCSPGPQASCQVLGEARKLELCWASCHCGLQAKPCFSLSYQASPPILPWYPWVVIREGRNKQGLLFSVLGTEPKGCVPVRQPFPSSPTRGLGIEAMAPLVEYTYKVLGLSRQYCGGSCL